MGNSKIDLNTVPYDAPLRFELPSRKWVSSQCAKGRNSTTTSVSPVDLSGKWVIITGSNNGIGREAALQMAEWGANLILGCRNPPPHETHPEAVVEECKEKAKKSGKQIEVEWWELDMASLKSVEAFAKRWLDTGRALDILCNNAGMGSSPGGSEVFRTEDGFEIIHQVCLPYHPSNVMENVLIEHCKRSISSLTSFLHSLFFPQSLKRKLRVSYARLQVSTIWENTTSRTSTLSKEIPESQAYRYLSLPLTFSSFPLPIHLPVLSS